MFGLFKKRGKKSTESAAEKPSPSAVEMIKVVDSYGRELQITRTEWRDKVLQPNLAQYWNDPDRLYQMIIDALNDDMAADVAAASERLLATDPLVERSHVIRAIVLMKLEDAAGADATLRAAIASIGETGTLLTNQAKALYQLGDEAGSLRTLERSLLLDPNQDNGLEWWCAILRERDGESRVEAELARLAQLPGSWRPQLLLGQALLQRDDHEQAVEHFRHVLSVQPEGQDALMVIGASLGQKGFLAEAIDLVAPIFDPQRHDPRAGFNLLQVYLQSGEAAPGLALLERFYALKQPSLQSTLQHFSQAFDQLVKQPPHQEAAMPKIVMRQLDLPPWLAAMHDMAWAAPSMEGRETKVLLMALSAHGESTNGQVRSGREDDRGRFARALPLYLHEQLIFRSELQSVALIPTTDENSLVLFGQPWSEDELRHFVEGYEYVVEGDIGEREDGFVVTWRVRSAGDLNVLLRLERSVTTRELGPAVSEMAEEMLHVLQRASGSTSPGKTTYYAPPRTFCTEYLSALAQTLVLTLLESPGQRERLFGERLFGERNIYTWMQNLALSMPDNEAAQFMYFTALAKGRRYASPIVDEFERPAAERLRSLVDAQSYAARVAPLVTATFPASGAIRDAATSVRVGEDAKYAAWVERVQSSF
ncbi:tetratricopeptide repeat protein [Dyella koreensis]|uniref:Tetratricopeptide repeat protein n=1 Tax=Dyella koreensis TaxID=311235 RepID=A0ABW8JYQ6_9GAMM